MDLLSIDGVLLFRLSFFLGVLAVLMLCEHYFPRRRSSFSKKTRWTANLTLVTIDTLCLRLLFPLLAIDFALIASERGWGLFNYWELSWWLAFILGVIILDFMIYLQHVLFHVIPFFWRFHKVHHTDLDFDATTGVRFHPVEIIVSMGIKIAVVVFLGIPALAVLVFEILLNAGSMFTHSNIKLPISLDRVIRFLIVTPDVHRIHHSPNPAERDRNFGFNLSLWDRFLGTYRDQPSEDHERMTIGIGEYRAAKYLKLHWLLAIPFTSSFTDRSRK